MKSMIRAIIGVGLGASAVFAQAQFSLFAAETISGSLGGNTSLYGGIQQYNFASTGGVATVGAGVDSSLLHDPAGLRAVGNKVYVGNRWGNQAGQGSVQEFSFDGTSLSFSQDITGNGLQRTHGLDVNPITGELAAVNAGNGGASRFSAPGFTANGMWNGGDWRDLIFSADGTKAYVTELNSTIRIIDIASGTSSTFGVAGANAMHQMAWNNGSLYVTAFNSSSVHRVDLDANGNPISSAVVATPAAALGIAFSLDGQEMFVSGHTSNTIFRYMNNNGVWDATGTIDTGHNMGYLAVADAVPEPGTMALLGLGAMAVLRRRKK